MKIRPNSLCSYDEIKAISDEMYAGKRDYFASDMRKIIEKHGNKLRPSPHTTWAITFSIPKSLSRAFVVGVRYRKGDNTFTEDHFLFQKRKNMEAFSKDELERKLPEYRGAHKEQPEFIERGQGTRAVGSMFNL